MDTQVISYTPFTVPPAVIRPYTDPGRTPVTMSQDAQGQTTPFSAHTTSLRRSSTLTRTGEHASTGRAAPSGAGDVLVKTRDDRMALLAKKFEGGASREDEARLEILTQRLRRMVPAFDSRAIAHLEAIATESEVALVNLAEIRSRYGLQ